MHLYSFSERVLKAAVCVTFQTSGDAWPMAFYYTVNCDIVNHIFHFVSW